MRVEVEGYGVAEVDVGLTLLEACEQMNAPILASCGGFACCNSCRVTVLDGAEHLGPCLDEELPFLDDDRQRLACQARVGGPVFVRLSPGA